MADRVVMRTGEALVEGDLDYLCAEPEIVIGALDGPVGHALANLIGDQVKGHTRVFAILNSDVQVRPATVLAERAKTARAPALAPSLSRCRHHVEACLGHLRAAHHVALFDEPAELMALELRLALDHLGEMVGAVYTDDLLDRIFSRFCIGK